MQRGEDEQVKYVTWRGGIQDAFDALSPEAMLKGMQSTDDENKAIFHLQTMLEADEGVTISGDKIADLIKGA